MIRPANKADLFQLLEFGGYFWKQTPYFGKIPYNADAVRELLLDMMDNHYVTVYLHGTQIVGFLGIFLSPLIFNPEYTVATEVFFFVSPAKRGYKIGDALFRHAELELGAEADVMAFGDMTTSTDMEQMYTDRGYAFTERTFTKVS